MNRQLLLNKFMTEEVRRYTYLHDKLSDLFVDLPKGSITRIDEGRYSRVVRDGGKQFKMALGPNDEALFQQLKLRRQIKDSLPLLDKKINAGNQFLLDNIIYDPLQLELPEQYMGVNQQIFLPGDVDPEIWAKANYRKKQFYKNDIRHYTEGGLMTRSKSEAMIGTQLEHSSLFFRYEQALQVGARIIYPDFIILHPITRRLVYWEHFGKMDDPDYALNAMKKLNDYARNGFLLGYNLFMTFETLGRPLTIKDINNKIQEILNIK